jgi:flagellar P-ring protein precursor FlgI
MALLSRRKGRGASPAVAAALALVACAAALGGAGAAHAARIKDIAFVEGIRPNQLSGYGIVVGLQGTGDGQQALFTIQSILNMLRRRGVLITVDPRQIRVKNAAAVLVTASLPPFARSGDRIDVQVSSLGDAKSLRGGTLISTPLTGGDQQVYAVAQGAVSLGGGFATSAPGASVSSGHPTAGIVPDGAIVEREVPAELAPDGTLRLSLHRPDITTATRVAQAINVGTRAIAEAIDPKTIEVGVAADDRLAAMQLLTAIESLQVTADTAARILVNERTGTVIIGQDVRVRPVAIAHGALQVEVKTEYGVSQPAPFSDGETVVVPDSTIVAQEGQKGSLAILSRGVSLGQLVGSLNALGVTPQDLIAVLEAIQAAGALEAELVIM